MKVPPPPPKPTDRPINRSTVRPLALFAFALLLWQTAPPGAFTRNTPVPPDERTYETSRAGFRPIERPGLLRRDDFVRLILRREGDFRFPLTVNFRKWRMADPPELWNLDLPGVLKLKVDADGAQSVSDGSATSDGLATTLRLPVNQLYNLPLVVRNQTEAPRDLHLSAELGGVTSSLRVTLDPGDNYVVLNLRPTQTGDFRVRLGFGDGTFLSRFDNSIEFDAQVVQTGTLRLRTLEDGSPVHARVYLTGSDGLSYAPSLGTLSKITWTAGDYFFYSTGQHEIRLPAGEARIEIVRGFEYEPIVRHIQIRPGQTARLTANLRRFSHVAEQGWWGGDVHIHANYNDHEFITPADMLIQTLGEDLNVANLMVANSSGAQVHDREYFTAQPHPLSRPRYVLRWIEEMRAALYGHMCLPGIKQLVTPLYTGFRDSPNPYDYPPNYYQAKAAQEAGGVASYAHPGYNFTDDPFTMSARELPVDLALGAVEAMDVLANPNEESSVPFWYALLNTGLECAASGGSDSFTNRRHHWLPGGQRVYVRSGPTLDYDAWIEAYRRGRSFVSNGPMLTFTVDGEAPGARLNRPAGARVAVKASAHSLIPMENLELVVNGEVIAVTKGPARELTLTHSFELTEGSWIAARVDGDYHRYLVNDTHLFAHTSPVYVKVGGKRVAKPEDARFFVRWIDRLIEGVEKRGRFERPEHLTEVTTLFRKAQDYYKDVAAGR